MDTHSRQVLSDQLIALHQNAAPAIILSLRPQDGIPSFVTHVLQLRESEDGQVHIRYIGDKSGRTVDTVSTSPEEEAGKPSAHVEGEAIVTLKNINVSGRTPILKDVSWKIRQGEKCKSKAAV